MKTRRYLPEIARAAASIPIFNAADVGATRRGVAEYRAALAADGFTRLTAEKVSEREIMIAGPNNGPELKLRIYEPETKRGIAFVNFHGGGFITGDLENEHVYCLTMARDAGAVSVGVEYRLAPEHPYPAGVEDCYRALEWVFENAERLGVEKTKIVVGGGSAGGCLSAAVAMMARDRGGPPIALQMLFYPVIDDRCSTRSMREGADCFVWNSQNCRDMWDQYIGKDRQNVSPYAAPARAADLTNLPPAYITTCEHDPLRDEAIEYAQRLMQCGVQVELHNYAGTVHAFDILIPSEVADSALAESVSMVQRLLR